MNSHNYKPLYETEFLGNLIDPIKFAEYKKETERKLSRKDTVNLILKCMKDNKDIIDDEDREIFNKILGDHQILDKIIFVTDGSHRNHRVWFSGGFFITEENYMGYSDNSPSFHYYFTIPSKVKLNYLKNNYEFIFVHIADYSYDNENSYHPEFEYDSPSLVYLK